MTKTDLDFFLNQNIALDLNTFIINLIGGRYYSPRGKKIDMIINKINNKKLSKVTLGGCIIEMQHETVIISKEY